ncbi:MULTISPECIES: mannonate dehydratase [Chitinophagaceae]
MSETQYTHGMIQMMRWFGPNDVCSLADIRQAGCSEVVTALHHIPVGDVWTIEEIKKRVAVVEAAGLKWTVVESLPVSEDIKTQSQSYLQHIDNYKQSIENLARCGIKVITYNFMPVLDWIRTDIAYPMADGSLALRFEKNAFIAFDLFMLQRENAANDYTQEEIDNATQFFQTINEEKKQTIFKNLLLGLPGSDDSFTAASIKEALKTYQYIDAKTLQEHLFFFLREVMPTVDACDMMMAIHPDDPPYTALGLPRIASTEKDIEAIVSCYASERNGLCFCTGSLGVRPDNDLLRIIERFGAHIHFLHLRNTKRDNSGNFYEADHLDGDVDMYAVVAKIVRLMHKRNVSLPMRPDHGHQMLDDLHKKTYPGYSTIGRLKGLAELRGLELGVSRSLEECTERL